MVIQEHLWQFKKGWHATFLIHFWKIFILNLYCNCVSHYFFLNGCEFAYALNLQKSIRACAFIVWNVYTSVFALAPNNLCRILTDSSSENLIKLAKYKTNLFLNYHLIPTARKLTPPVGGEFVLLRVMSCRGCVNGIKRNDVYHI